MSNAIVYPNCPDISARRDIGFSDDFQWLNKYADKEIANFRRTETFTTPIAELIDSLMEAYKDCSVEDWDGMGGVPVTESTILDTAKLISLLPSNLMIPLPTITVESSGEIALEWYRGHRSIFVVSVNRIGKIIYSGLYGTSNTHGSEYLSGTLPSIIIDNLKRLYSKD